VSYYAFLSMVSPFLSYETRIGKLLFRICWLWAWKLAVNNSPEHPAAPYYVQSFNRCKFWFQKPLQITVLSRNR
jgi:hypothetical protein